MHETFAEDPTCLKNCSINGAVPQCLTSLLNDYENRGGICKDSLMDSEVTYKPFNIRPARPDETLDYTGIWKVSSEPCSVSGTVTIGHDPQEIAPKITMPTAYCAASTATCTVSTNCDPGCTDTSSPTYDADLPQCCLPKLAGVPYCAPSTTTCTTSTTACDPACTGTDICCSPTTGPYCAASTTTCTTSTACTPACTGTDKCCDWYKPYCAADTTTCITSTDCAPACTGTDICCSPILTGGPYCAASTTTCTASTACTPACTGTDICCLPGLCSDETEVIFH